jgi:hypothetical protein
MTSQNPNKAIILAQEITKGMKSIGSKALLEISKNLTILEYQIQYLKKCYYPIEIYICTGFEHEKIIKLTSKYKNIYYSYNEQYEEENQAGGLIKCIKKYNISNGALILNNGFIPLEKIPINKNKSSIQVTDKTLKIPFQIGAIDSKNLSYLFYGLPFKWTESIFLNKQSLTELVEVSESKICNKLFLFELINILMDRGITIDAQYINRNLPIKLNSIKELAIAKKYYEKHMHNKIKQ